MREMVKAPWTDAFIDNLKKIQDGTYLAHPYTCGNRGDGKHEGEGKLTPTRDGWVCPSCSYTQNWAHHHRQQ